MKSADGPQLKPINTETILAHRYPRKRGDPDTAFGAKSWSVLW